MLVASNKHKIASVDITDKMGERIKTAREDRGYTRAQLSERSGISERYIIGIENEGSIPKVAVLNDLLRGLGLSADSIFYLELIASDPELEQVARLYLACDKRERKIVIDLINSLLDSREDFTNSLGAVP
ncbi:XRE family transcriptional regulator [Anaerotruncus sp. X29]|nr:XRE family transcriptional regulator [Anaerotruncus sp. 1XD42-93]NCE76619.1 XRE family transcriptional regulator [Anaerotruncus sp. X29]RKJ74931.1 XRE family transcriptional regulator [Anaerotruncus sp. 1XD22-93]